MSYREPPVPVPLPPGLTRQQAAWLTRLDARIAMAERTLPAGERDSAMQALIKEAKELEKKNTEASLRAPRLFLLGWILLNSTGSAMLVTGFIQPYLRAAGTLGTPSAAAVAYACAALVLSTLVVSSSLPTYCKMLENRADANSSFTEALEERTARIHQLAPSPAPSLRVETTPPATPNSFQRTRVADFAAATSPTDSGDLANEDTAAHAHPSPMKAHQP